MARGRPPLLALRTQRALKRDDVVDSLVDELGLDRAKRKKVERYYHRLETGLLDPRASAGGLRRAGADVASLTRRRPRLASASLATEGVFLRRARAEPSRATDACRRRRGQDEIDVLFLEGGDGN